MQVMVVHKLEAQHFDTDDADDANRGEHGRSCPEGPQALLLEVPPVTEIRQQAITIGLGRGDVGGVEGWEELNRSGLCVCCQKSNLNGGV